MTNKELLSNQGQFSPPKILFESVTANTSVSSYDKYLAALQENYDDQEEIAESIQCCEYGHRVNSNAPNLAYEYARAFSSHPADEEWKIAPPVPEIPVHAIEGNQKKLKIAPTVPENFPIPLMKKQTHQLKEGLS
ncbi:hypothetical protein IQ225_02435 [Synechocystis salina LEGE 06155]|nr:hypothetical protein [Synechocystis salina LEGE 06155]